MITNIIPSSSSTQAMCQLPAYPAYKTLGDVPLEILYMITYHLDDLSLVNLLRTCKGFQFALQPEKDKRARQGFLAPAISFRRADTRAKYKKNAVPGIDMPRSAITYLLRDPPAVEDLPFEGYLIRTIQNSQFDALKALLDLGARPDSFSTTHKWLLTYAAESGNMEIVKLLLERGASAHKIDRDPMINPLVMALWKSEFKIAELLIDNGAELDCDEVKEMTIKVGSIEFIRMTLEKGIDLRYEEFLNWAVDRGDLAVFNFLLPLAMSLNTLNMPPSLTDFPTALHCAASAGHVEMASALIAAGIDLNRQADIGQTALHVALRNKHLDVARVITQAGCQLNIISGYDVGELHVAMGDERWGWPPARIEVSAEKLSIIDLLLSKGADVNMRDLSDDLALETPLWYAIRHGSEELVERFLAYQPDLTIRDQDGRTPLELAKLYDYRKIAAMLK